MSDTGMNSDGPEKRDLPPSPPLAPILPKSASEALRPERLPEPPARRSRSARSQAVVFFNFVMSILVLAAVAIVGVFYYAVSAFQEKGPLPANVNFVVRNGATLAEISGNLERNGIISDGRIFRYMTSTYLAKGDTLRTGEYEIKAGASMQDIMELLKSGKSILYSVSLPEGLTVKQIYDRLKADPVLEGDLPSEMPAEGSLRPDTYKFSRGTRRDAIVKQAQLAQSKLVDEVWAKRDSGLPLKDKSELVILASIVERETGKADERPRVAAVFYNRLKKNMRLQSDPTVVYGLFGGEGKPSDRPILKADLEKDTPYNTYIIKGLPPGPIANPGKAALEAVANPWKSDDLYFVADGTGGHVFASNLKDHNANVDRWRKLQAAQGQAADAVVDGQPDGPDQPDTASADAQKKKKK